MAAVGIPWLEGYELVKKGVHRNRRRFYSLFYSYDDEDDVVHEVTGKLLKEKFFEKYDPEKCSSKEGYVGHAVYTTMADLVKKQHPVLKSGEEATILYADKPVPTQEGTYLDYIIDDTTSIEDMIVGDMERDRILDLISDKTDSTLKGHSKEFGEVSFTLRTIVKHLEIGYTIKEICALFVNPKSGRPVSGARVSQLIKQIRDIVSDVV